MRIRSRLPLLLAVVAPLVAQTEAPSAWQPHRALKVLYAGQPDGSRERAFAEFLALHFDHTGTIDLAELSMETAKDYDVVIADWISQYGNDGYPERRGSLYSAPVSLPESFTKPVITMTYVSTQLRSDYKLDWL